MEFLIPILFIVVLVAWRVVAGRLDRERIRSDIGGRGGEVLHIEWEPSPERWFLRDPGRLYRVGYSDAEGNFHSATAKTWMFGGVYWNEPQ